MESSSTFTELVEYIVKSIVDEPEQVEVSESRDQGVIQLEVSVAPDDMGRVIGRRGSVVNSIRTLLGVLAVREGASVSLEIK